MNKPKLPRYQTLNTLSWKDLKNLIDYNDDGIIVQVKLGNSHEWNNIEMPKGMNLSNAFTHLSKAYGVDCKFRVAPTKTIELTLENGKTISKEVDDSFDFSEEAVNDLCEQVSSDEGYCVESLNI